MRLPLRYYGDPVLKRRALPVREVDERLRRLAEDMIDTMRAEQGIGLAAQQVGETVALCVIEVPPESDADAEGRPLNPGLSMPIVMFNPRIVRASSQTEAREEGCLSFPDIRATIVRPVEVTVQWLGLDGRPTEATLRGLTARCVQHEMDHLDGILISDRMSPVARIALAGRLKRLRRETEASAGTVRAG
ncbi:MAG: peptide deformylase [Kiritimatiellae bacterium]|nr:peptide deformylase [Kiritimatiellia bacterium]